MPKPNHERLTRRERAIVIAPFVLGNRASVEIGSAGMRRHLFLLVGSVASSEARDRRRARMSCRVDRAVLTTVLFLFTAAGCGENRPFTFPSPVLTPGSNAASASPARLLSGVVYEATAVGRQPLAEVRIDVSAEYQTLPPAVVTDAAGRYSVEVLAGQNLKIIAERPGYSQPCRVPVARGVTEQDVYLVSDATLAMSGIPSTMPTVPPILTGRVFERTSQGPRPISDAAVIGDFSGGNGWAPSATTKTDPDGRYSLCNVDNKVGGGLLLLVSKPGYTSVAVPGDPGGNGDVELIRQ
jgi:hypothetical protein